MAVRKESLPALVRATAMNAYKHIQHQKEANYKPFVTRRVRKFRKFRLIGI
jgi:hypothetical protein